MKKTAISAILATTTLLAMPASAEYNLYAGLNVGQADIKDACSGLDSGFAGSCDDGDTGWRLYGGYQFMPYLGVELFYADLGETKLNGEFLGVRTSGVADVEGFGLYATGTVPMGRFALFGKAGVFRSQVEMDVTVAGASVSTDADGTDFAFGVGASYAVSDNFAIRAEWERFNDLGGDNLIGETDVDFVSAGIVFSF